MSRRTQSFSSSLLDAIYRSIDESKSSLDEDNQKGLHKETYVTKQSNLGNKASSCVDNGGCRKERMNLRRAVMVEDLMEKQSSSNSHASALFTSTSSSSESSCSVLAFSSSETEATFKSERSQKHISSEKKPQGGFTRTKLRALKIYGELNKKVKKPISPGGRIASFINSIFNSGNVKKAKMCYVGAAEDVSFDHKSKSPCFSTSTGSSFSRSCLRKKAPSSSSSRGGKSGNGSKRSVRFYPVSVILGEDNSQPSRNRYIYEEDPTLMPLPTIRKFSRSSSIKELQKYFVKEKEKELMKKGNEKKCKYELDLRNLYYNDDEEFEEDKDEDDAESCSSSDLFELDHLIGIGRYNEELPVYETTNLKANKAIANGLLF